LRLRHARRDNRIGLSLPIATEPDRMPNIAKASSRVRGSGAAQVKPVDDYLRELRTSTVPTRQAAGKRSVKSAATVQAALKAAGSIFREQGYAAFSMRRVASKARMSLGTLTYHFRDKDELLNAMTANYYVIYGHRVAQSLRAARTNPRKRFEALLTFFIQDHLVGTARQFDLEFWAYSKGDATARRLLDDSLEVTRRIYAGMILEVNPTLSGAQALRISAVVATLIDALAFAVDPESPQPPSARHLVGDIQAAVWKLVGVRSSGA
jgi:AcrR family transcriptional regulator